MNMSLYVTVYGEYSEQIDYGHVYFINQVILKKNCYLKAFLKFPMILS